MAHLLFGAKNIERTGDPTTNIAGNIVFLVTGKALTDDRPKGDDTSSVVPRPPIGARFGAKRGTTLDN